MRTRDSRPRARVRVGAELRRACDAADCARVLRRSGPSAETVEPEFGIESSPGGIDKAPVHEAPPGASSRDQGVDLGGMNPVHRSFTTAELRAGGLTRARIRAAVAAGMLIRTRRGFYVPSSTPDAVVRASRVGGRLTCLSLLLLMGVFVLRTDMLHVHMVRNASRMRSPHSGRVRLEPRSRRGVRLHWVPLIDDLGRDSTCVSIVDALAHAVLCQPPRAAIATIDSALHLGYVSATELGEVFRALPKRYRALQPLIDGRAESGPETLMRLLLRSLGCRVDVQVEFEGVGRVDLLVDGWLVIECDSREFHQGWEQRMRDHDRDLALAALGLVTLRVTAAQIMYRYEEVLQAVKGLLGSR
jgi:very-short-patch-repair endonuclease